MTRTQIPAFSATSSRIISRGDVIFDDLQLPPRLLAAIFRVDIYRERGLDGSNIAFKKLGRTALNHDRIISHDCPPLKRVYASCVCKDRRDRPAKSFDILLLLDDFHSSSRVRLNFLITRRTEILFSNEEAATFPKSSLKCMNHHQRFDSRLQHRFTQR